MAVIPCNSCAQSWWIYVCVIDFDFIPIMQIICRPNISLFFLWVGQQFIVVCLSKCFVPVEFTIIKPQNPPMIYFTWKCNILGLLYKFHYVHVTLHLAFTGPFFVLSVVYIVLTSLPQSPSRLISLFSSGLSKSWCPNSRLIRWDTQTTSSGKTGNKTPNMFQCFQVFQESVIIGIKMSKWYKWYKINTFFRFSSVNTTFDF